MTTTELRPLDYRRRLGPEKWEVPREFGPNGWVIDEKDKGNGYGTERRIIISLDTGDAWHDGGRWVHASISYRDRNIMPDYDDLQMLHRTIWPDGHAYQVFVPPSEHVNIRANALHLWGRADGARVLPNFGFLGTI